MDKNTITGFVLIALILGGFSFINYQNGKKIKKQTTTEQQQEQTPQTPAELQCLPDTLADSTLYVPTVEEIQTLRQQELQRQFGAFTPSCEGVDEDVILKNDQLVLTLATKGGWIRKAELTEYNSYMDKEHALQLIHNNESQLNFLLSTQYQKINTQDLYFADMGQQETEDGYVHTLRLTTDQPDSYLDFVYTLPKSGYMLDFAIVPHNMQDVLANNTTSLPIQWGQLIRQQERGRKFENRYARLQYKQDNDDSEQLKEEKNDSKDVNTAVKWIAYKDQFFSTILIANEGFSTSHFESQQLPAPYIKEYQTRTTVPMNVKENKSILFRLYIGPNHYNTLKAFNKGVDRQDRLNLQEVVPLGWKIVAWINKALVIPMFDIFSRWGLHIGWIILLMTLVIKLIILPFVYSSYKSSAKMRVLKPQMDAINEKYPPEKMQERQQEIMKLYQRAGVSPMSGCLPMLFQFPVLMAMFWFLPTAIELRGKSLFWAEDLSAYDAILTWNFNIPFLGDHLSLFCLLMTACNIAYTYINMQSQSTGQEMKFMKYMMYAMPIMFLFIFNDYAAGLSYYYLISLFITIAQTMIFRWATDDEKLLAQMEANAKKKAAKGKSKFMQRLEQMQQEQMRAAREQAKANQRKMR